MQTIGAYPNGGGSFTVAKENLGERAGLVAASALALDYVLNVAVAIAAGVGALVSVVPSLLPHTLLLCLLALGLLVAVNLRGVRATGGPFMAPTYLFVAGLGTVLVIGAVRAVLSHGHPVPVARPPAPHPATAAASAWLLLRAFSNGCTAMTGIEAVSNGVPVFREPRQREARRTLVAIGALLGLLVLGIALAATAYGVAATPPGESGYQSVLSQLVGAIVGRGLAYGVVLGAAIAVLALSANTSFADFPRLCNLLALDHFLPSVFAHRGRRLAFSMGIAVLAALSGALLIVFQGITDRLIPLFAIGAFLAFTLSQSGMVVHWKRARSAGSRAKLAVNAVGAASTGVALIVILVSKFRSGAWISVILLTALSLLLLAARRRALRRAAAVAIDAPLEVAPAQPPRVIVPLRRWERAGRNALRFAMTISPDVEVVQILTHDQQAEDDLRPRWEALVTRPASAAGRPAPRLVVLNSEYRELLGPLVRLVRRTVECERERTVAVIVPEVVRARWYRRLGANPMAALLKEALRLETPPRLVIVSVPLGVARTRTKS